jgi:hypothetical protein
LPTGSDGPSRIDLGDAGPGQGHVKQSQDRAHVTQPMTAWLARKKLFERVRLWVISLGPYPSLALFAVPVIILEPAKPLAGYLLGTGHFFAGAVTFITAEVLKLKGIAC